MRRVVTRHEQLGQQSSTGSGPGQRKWWTLRTSKKVEITIRIDRRLMIQGSITTRCWCQGCGCETDAVSCATAGTVAEAMAVGLGEPMITRDLHYLPAGEGKTKVCLRSLLEMVRREGECSKSRTSSLVPNQ
jgi:hypothetical protein